ncbi:MAG: 2-dehydropantoate 2-reductase [Fibrobacter sp.]|nr:2-dehydropantoate 2-reductase [Fibrobacter sp.]
MKGIQKVAVIGLGAVGAVVAEQLQSVLGNELYCVMDAGRKARYETNGMFINGKKMEFHYVTPSEVPQVDLVIFATKNLQFKEALAEAKNAVGPHTVLLSLLNGVHSELEMEKAFGAEKTLYGFIVNLQSINRNGVIDCAAKGIILFGEKDNRVSERVQAISNLFDAAQVKHKVPENIRFEMWKKLLMNTVFNSLGAICRSPFGGFMSPVMQQMARKVGREVIAVANAEGFPLTEEHLEEDLRITCHYTPLGKCSMLQDVEAGRKTENAFFCGTICELGKRHGIPTPYCEFLRGLLEGTEFAADLRKKN